MLYITFNDPPSGIYFSQVTDVCKFIEKQFGIRVQLLAFISLRNFLSNKRAIRAAFPHSMVLPMFPGVKNWKRNLFALSLKFFLIKPRVVIARGPFATWLALQMKKKGKVKSVCFDARGAYTAEFNEYNVSGKNILNSSMRDLECLALEGSDHQIAVSHALTDYWKKEFGFERMSYEVIPCTIDNSYESNFSYRSVIEKRKELKIEDDEVLMVYSGSNAAWQSLDTAFSLLEKWMQENKKIKVLILSRGLENERFVERYKERILVRWVSPEKVRDLLLACDYGILIRDRSITNSVSSPVKFAEYLACGLKVIISDQIGDYSDFVKRNDCGFCLSNSSMPAISRLKEEDKRKMKEVSEKYFTKKQFIDPYKRIIAEDQI